MTDAFECDRCGELFGSPAEMKVATGSMQEVGGEVRLQKHEPGRSGTTVGNPGTSLFRDRPNATYEIKQGDLCEDCAEAFREFWSDTDE